MIKKNKKTQHKTALRREDMVRVIAGNDKGKSGKVLSIDFKKYGARVEGMAMQTHFVKPSKKNAQGGLLKKEGLIHLSNLQLLIDDQPTRVGKKRNDDGKLVRYAKKTGNPV